MKVKMLNRRHPSVDWDRMQIRRSLFSPEEHPIQKVAGKILPKFPEEEQTAWAQRIAAMLYTNHFSPIVNTLSGGLCLSNPDPENLTEEWVAPFLENVDRQRSSFGAWAQAAITDALVDGFVWVFVELPAGPEDEPVEFANRLEQENTGALDPWLVTFTSATVVNWRDGEKPGEIAWVMTHTMEHYQPEPDSPDEVRHTWTAITPTEIRRWRATESEKQPLTDDSEATELPKILHGRPRIPVVRLTLPGELHAGAHMLDPAIAHLRARNSLSWALDRGAHPLLWIREKIPSLKPVLGAGMYVSLGQFDDIGYVEPAGSSASLLSADVVALREELYRVVRQMAIGADSNASRSMASAESKSQDWIAMEIVLGALASVVRPFLVDVLRLVYEARAEQIPADVGIAGMDGWKREDAQAWLTSSALAVNAPRMSPTFTKEIAKAEVRQVLKSLAPEVLDKIMKEIDEAPEDEQAPFTQPPPPDMNGDPKPNPRPNPTPKPNRGLPAPATSSRPSRAKKA